MTNQDRDALRALIRQNRITNALDELFLDMGDNLLREQDDLQEGDQAVDFINRRTTWLTAQRALYARLPEIIREASRIPEQNTQADVE